MGLGLLLMNNCTHCDGLEERLFTDSWTGMELCLSCIYPIVGKITMSPQTEGDNLPTLLKEESWTAP